MVGQHAPESTLNSSGYNMGIAAKVWQDVVIFDCSSLSAAVPADEILLDF